MGQFHFDPDSYLELMAQEVPDYERLQDEAAAASALLDPVRRVLDLGTGTGETARRVLDRHPQAELVGIDSSPAMLARARRSLPDADLRVARLEDPLPEGRFDIAGPRDPEFDFRYLPSQTPDSGLFIAAVRHYQQRSGRTLDLDRVMAWHIRTVLGDALWRSEAGVALPGGGDPSTWVNDLKRRLRKIEVRPTLG